MLTPNEMETKNETKIMETTIKKMEPYEKEAKIKNKKIII